jgi:hypothetical protein
VSDLTGTKFGKLKVLSKVVVKGARNGMWLCRCECGQEIVAQTTGLKHGIKTNCGCIVENKDLTGRQFLKLLVIKRVKSGLWRCLCDCGETVEKDGRALRSGNTKSCGCLRLEVKPASYKHGKATYDVRLYRIWRNMKQRCLNANCPDFHLYGGRGIKICQDWTANFEAFFDWSMSHGYAADLQIDRINCDGSYSPRNCRWVTPRVNSWNKREIKRYRVEGESLTLTEIAAKFQIARYTLDSRIKNGMSVQQAIKTKVVLKPRKRAKALGVKATAKTAKTPPPQASLAQ